MEKGTSNETGRKLVQGMNCWTIFVFLLAATLAYSLVLLYGSTWKVTVAAAFFVVLLSGGLRIAYYRGARAAYGDAESQLGEFHDDLLVDSEKLGGKLSSVVALVERYEDTLQKIDTSTILPAAYRDNPAAQAEWWKHLASTRRELAHDALRET